MLADCLLLKSKIYYGPLKLTVLILREDQQNYGAPYSMGSCPFAIFLPALIELFIAQVNILTVF